MPVPEPQPWRVALFTDTFDEVSGVGHTFRLLADHCERRGIELDVFTVTTAPSSLERRGTVCVHRLQPRVPFSYYPGLFLDLMPLDDTALTEARGRPYDVIHIATPGHMGVTGLYLAARQGVPTIGSYHTEFPQYIVQRLNNWLGDDYTDDPDAVAYVEEFALRLAWEFLAGFYNRCEKVLVPSEATHRSVAEHLRVPIERFERGVDTDLFSPRRRMRPADAPVRVLYVGRLAVEKNLAWLVAFGQAQPDCELVIVGDGPERAGLELELPRARFAGVLQDEELAQAYADADVFACPSLTETFGNVVLEAQASGLPAVVGHLGGPREIIAPGESGLVADSAESFVAHLQALVTNAERRRAMAVAARRRAEQRRWDDVFARLFAQYATVLYPPGRRSWRRFLRRLEESDHPLAVGLVSFWKQFGRRREARARQQAQP
jgi:glycosyltransferase involved in cell wall biosynthesis